MNLTLFHILVGQYQKHLCTKGIQYVMFPGTKELNEKAFK
jgi:hypothetical protein